MALTAQLGVEEELAEEVMVITMMTIAKAMAMAIVFGVELPKNADASSSVPYIASVCLRLQVMESTVDACKVVEACLTCTDLRFNSLAI